MCVLLDKKIADICKCEYRYFFNKTNVVGVGRGYKIKRGFCTNEKCITIFVSKKLCKNHITINDEIPRTYKGIITDVVESGFPKICSLTKKIRPALGGYCIGVDGLQSGSIGCLVGDSSKDYILTCNHVVSGNSSSNINKVVVQPSPKYGGKIPKDAIGSVDRFIPIDESTDDNLEDAAIVETNRSKSSIAIAFKGTLKGTDYGQIGQIVEKVGATTELTTGVIQDDSVTIKVNFLGRETVFKEQIVTTQMSSQGDSGSVLLNSKNQVLGLLMADTSTISIYNNIHHMLEVLNVNILRN